MPGRYVCICVDEEHERGGLICLEKNAQAKDMFKIRKVCLTRAVFMALLKWQPEGVVQVLPDDQQLFKDGTIFVVHDFQKVCALLMQTYALASWEPVQVTDCVYLLFHTWCQR